MKKHKVIVAISGASGAVYGIRALEILGAMGVETHLILSSAGEMTIGYETEYTAGAVKKMADYTHSNRDVGAICASGTFQADGMIIAPCSMKTLGEIGNGICGNLLTRTADVILKERRPLVLMPREMPLNLSHIRNMETVTLMGGIVCPPVPAWYTNPKTVDDIIYQTTARSLEMLKLPIPIPDIARWKA